MKINAEDYFTIIEYLKSTNDANALELIKYFQTELDYEIEMLRFFT